MNIVRDKLTDVALKRWPGLGVLCLTLFLASCSRHGSIDWALGAIHEYKSTAEMSGFGETNRVDTIVRALKTERGADSLAAAYKKTSDNEFKERLLYIGWRLTFHTTPEVRGRIAAFLLHVLEAESGGALHNWALTGLTYCGLPSLEEKYLEMLQSDEPALWLRGALGLWRIRSEAAAAKLAHRIDLRRTNSEFEVAVRQMVLQDSNQWTGVILQSLNASQGQDAVKP